MNLRSLWEQHVRPLAPMYYFDVGKIKRIDKVTWKNIPKKNNSRFKKEWVMNFVKYRGALRPKVTYERLLAGGVNEDLVHPDLPFYKRNASQFR